ncbi:MAG: alginate export family protein, partial [Planctomycetales bacterium]
QGGYQWGDAAGIGTGRQNAGFATVGIGRKLNHCWDPTIWLYFDYASRGYNQLFPLAHKYLGFIDAVQRSNVESPNVLITAKPHEKVTLLLWYYYFLAASPANVPSIGGTPVQNPRIRDFGQEIDFLIKYQWRPQSDFLIGYSHFFRGSRIVNPGVPGFNLSDADFIYTQWTLDF